MTLTRVLNDARATAVSAGARDRGKEMSSAVTEAVTDAKGPVYSIGRGVSDPSITYLALYRAGTVRYLFSNEAGDGLEVSLVKP